MNIKIEEQPYFVSTGRIVDEDNKYVAGTKTKEQAEKIVSLVSLVDELIKKYAND